MDSQSQFHGLFGSLSPSKKAELELHLQGKMGLLGLSESPWDLFHLGLLLVLIMVFITGIVICVAVTGVCCFHWLETRESRRQKASRNPNASSSSSTGPGTTPLKPVSRDSRNALQENRRNERKNPTGPQFLDVPPPYDALFPQQAIIHHV